MILEPCCFNKQLTDVIASPREVEHLFVSGGVDLQLMMDYFIRHSPGCDVYLVLVQVSDSTIRTIAKMMEAQINNGTEPLVRSFTLLSQGHQRKEIAEALGKYRQEGRLIVLEDDSAFRCLCVGNEKNSFVLQGSIPQIAGYSTQMMTLTKSRKHYDHVMSVLKHHKS